MIDRRNRRATYSAEVAAAMGDYMPQGGHFSFTSDGGGTSPLEIHFTLQDADLYPHTRLVVQPTGTRRSPCD